MARHPGARRVPHPAHEEDAFLGRSLEAAVWLKENRRAVIVVTVAAVALIAGLLYYRSYRNSMAERAETRLGEIRGTVASGNAALAERDLEQFVQRFGGTPSGDEGRLMLARLLLEAGRFEEAARAIAPAADEVDEPLGPQAAGLLAAAYEGSGQADRAEHVYLRVADNAELSYQRRMALEAAAQLRLRQNNPAGAAQLYERLVAMTEEGTAERALYEMRLAEARAQATG